MLRGFYAVVGAVRGVARLLAFILLCLISVPIASLMPRSPRRFQLVRWWHRTVCALLGVRVVKIGEPSDLRGAMIVCNHISYLDIVVLGGFLDAHFVAKSELEKWPFFGFLARLAETEFVVRDPRRAKEQRGRLGTRLQAGESLILFPEGTTSDGIDILPFKSSLFQAVLDAAEKGNRHIQPVTLAFDRNRKGHTLDLATRRKYAWYDDTPFVVHLLKVMSMPGATATLLFHAPIDVDADHCRKSVARLAQAEVKAGLDALRVEAVEASPATIN